MKGGRWTVWLKVIGVAVAAVLSVKAFLVTSCIIPSSGMENSLYRGEGILVDKWSYGLRMPFLSWFGYHRITAKPVKRGDIVLFNSPAPDVADTWVEWRPLFISRCIGKPGDTLMLDADLIDTGGAVFSPDSKAFYAYPADKEDVLLRVLEELGLSDNSLVIYTEEGDFVRSFSHYEFYLISQRAGEKIGFKPLNASAVKEVHPYVVPAKGKEVKVYPWNATLLCNTILQHEHRNASVRRDTLFVEGKPVSSFTFTKDYYWMASNDPVNLCDSRLFGFVPEDHVIGKAWRIWFTFRKGRFFQRVQ